MATVTLPADKFDKTMTFVRPASPPARVPLDGLKVLPGFNTRVKDEEYQSRVATIQASIQKHGFYDDKPFSVVMIPNDDTVYIFDGEHRFDAASLASLDGAEFQNGLPVAFAKDGATVKDLTVHLVHGNDGERLNPVEMAAVVRRLVDLGLSKDEIAAEIARTPRHVENLMVLAGAGTMVKRAVADGKIAAAEAVKLVRKHGSTDAAVKIADAIKVAEEKGKAKATPKTMATGPKMKTVRVEVSLGTGDGMGDVLKAMASQVRETIKTDADDKLVEDGRIVVSMIVIDHEATADAAKRETERAAAAEKRAAEKKTRDEKRAAEATVKAEAKAKRDAEKAAAKKTADAVKAKAAKEKAAAKAKADKEKAAAKAKAAADKAAAKKIADEAKAKAAAAGAKTTGEVKTAGATQKPAKTPAKAPATSAAPKAGKAAEAAPTDAKDPNKGL